MIHEEFEKLLNLLANVSDQDNPNINDLLKRTLAFFDAIKKGLVNSAEPEKKEILGLVQQMHDKLNVEVKRMMKKGNLSEEEIRKNLDSTQQFTQEQQDMISKTRKRVEETKKALAGERKTSKKPHKKKISGKRTKKGEWMKS